MDGLVDLAGHARLALVGADDALVRAVRRRMEPYELARVAPDAVRRLDPDVVVEADDGPAPRLRERIGDSGDGLVTAWDGRRLHVMTANGSCALPVPGERPARFSFRAGFPAWSILGPLVSPALQLAALEHGTVAIHGSAVEVGGAALLIGGWSESGKTETALAFAVSGDPLISDKWTFVGADGRVSAFPAPLTIRGWLLRYLPELGDALPSRSRAQLALAGRGAALVRPLRGRAPGGPVSALAIRSIDRTLSLAERTPLSARVARSIGEPDAATRSLRVSKDGRAPDERADLPMRAAVVLTTADAAGARIEVATAEPAWAAARLARSAVAERRTWVEVLRREAYVSLSRPGEASDPLQRGAEDAEAAPSAGERIERVREREEAAIARALAGVPVLEVRAPFPTDPRLVVEAIRSTLHEAVPREGAA